MATYKGAIAENGTKVVLKDGVSLINNPESVVVDWGWYGADCRRTAYIILLSEYGPAVADTHAASLCRDWLALQPDEGFELTSLQLAFLIKEFDKSETKWAEASKSS